MAALQTMYFLIVFLHVQLLILILVNQWRRQRSKGTRSFWGQNILEPGHPDALFFLKKVDDLF